MNLISSHFHEEKKYIRALLLIASILLWIALMAVVIWFSSKPAPESSKQSVSVGKWICSIVTPGFNSMPSDKQLEYAMLIEKFVRKTAHFIEFMVLGFFTINAIRFILSALSVTRLSLLELNNRLIIIISLIWCIIFATSDEIHQLFVPGRYGSPVDVLLDSVGSLCGIMLYFLIFRINKKAER